jgi:competence protein ComEA
MPELHLSRRQIVVGAVALLVVFAIASKLLLRPNAAASPPIPTAASTRPTTAPLLYVDVVGAVRRPGLYRLPHGARVADALTRAGGATRKAQLELVNLAAPVADGEQVVVPGPGVVQVSSAPGSPTAPVHLNSATLEQLQELDGIGPALAQRIVDYRSAHGGFRSLAELDEVSGIGPARLAALRGHVAL